MGCGSSLARFTIKRLKQVRFKISKFSPLGGGGVSDAKLEKAHMTHDDWMALTNRPDVVEKDMVKLLDWFIKVVSSELYVLTHRYQNYPSGGISQLLYKDFFPASATGERLAELVFRILDEDNGGSIGFPEIQKTIDLCNAKTFTEQVQWSFRIFDVDNSKSIAIDEFGDSIRQVWTIFDGIGETEHNPGTCENAVTLLVSKCKANTMSEVSEPEFVRVCILDQELGTLVTKIYRAFIGCWCFMYERWESGAFFTQTKPPTGPFWERMNNSMFNTLESHTVNKEEEMKRKREAEQAENDALAAKVAASLGTKSRDTEQITVDEVFEE